MANVLLVDDNGNVLLTLAIALRRHGHKVTVASDACQALAYLKRHRYDFLISDVRMPGMSGVELAAQARSLPKPPRIVLTSAYSNIDAREDVAEAFFRKPIDTQQLHALLMTPEPVDSKPDSRPAGNGGSSVHAASPVAAPQRRKHPPISANAAQAMA